MLGLGISKSAQSVKSGIVKLLSSLKRRAEYFENKKDSKSTIKEIKNYELLDKATILLTPTATSDARVHSVKTYAGDELVTNGDFANWTGDNPDNYLVLNEDANNYVTESNGQLRMVSDDSATIAIRPQPTNMLTPGGTYRVSVDLTFTTGTLNISGVEFDTDGTKVFYLTAGSGGYLQLAKASTLDVLIDNLSIVDVSSDFDFDRASSATRINSSGLVQDMQSITDPELVTNGTFDTDSDWTLGTGWSIANGKAVYDASSTSLLQSNVTMTNNNIYRAVIQVEDTSGSGNCRFAIKEDNNIAIGFTTYAEGTITLEFESPTDGLFGIEASSSEGSFDIISVSVKDITFSTDVDLARINYDSNGDNGHILLEPTSTNLIPYSENFKDGYSTTESSVDLNDAVSPDGTKTANKFNSTATPSSISKTYANSSALFHTTSIFLKKGTIDIVTLSVNGGTPAISASTTVNLTSGTITASSGNGSITPTITNYGNDWYRITASSTSNGNIANPTILIVNSSTTANGYFYMWGLQFEGLPYATSYIPNHGTALGVTRATETLTGSGNSTLINSTEGVLYAEIAALADDLTNRCIALSDGTADDRVTLVLGDDSNKIRAIVKSDGSTSFDEEYTVTSTLDYHKVAIKYKANDFALWIDGVERFTDTSGSAPIGLNKLAFDTGISILNFYGKCKALAVFNEALEDDELELLTGVTNYGSFSELASTNGYTII